METENSQLIDTTDLPSGFVISNRYEVIRQLGQGGMGSVYLVADRSLQGEQVAVKILHDDFAKDRTHTQRFLREVHLIRKINHKNIVQVFDVGMDEQMVFFAMEYLKGQPLSELVHQSQLSLNQLIEITIQICEGLDAIHLAGIIHRDLKPANILILDNNIAKITDFGVARPKVSMLTAPNEIIGSSQYMAPEVWAGKKLGPGVDFYSLGIMLYEITTGQLPFESDSPVTLMRMHVDRAPEPPKELNKVINSSLNRLILSLLAKSPLDRPKNGKEIISQLRSIDNSNALTQSQNNLQTSDSFIKKLEELSQKSVPTVQPETSAESGAKPNQNKLFFKLRRLLQKKNY